MEKYEILGTENRVNVIAFFILIPPILSVSSIYNYVYSQG